MKLMSLFFLVISDLSKLKQAIFRKNPVLGEENCNINHKEHRLHRTTSTLAESSNIESPHSLAIFKLEINCKSKL